MTSKDASLPPPGTPTHAIGFLLRLAHQRAAKSFSEALRPLGIEGRHFGVLSHLAREPLNQRQLIDRMNSDKASMVRLVDDLENRGLAVRRADPGDRRVRVVDITDLGRKTLASAEKVADDVVTRLLAHLEPAERRDLTTLLARFLDAPADPGDAGRARSAGRPRKSRACS